MARVKYGGLTILTGVVHCDLSDQHCTTIASWGVGKRGQLGHGKREDHQNPKLLTGGIGYGIRIVQVAAGGGLVRVAHSLLLTSHGKVLSFGTGQYGALGAICPSIVMKPTARFCSTNTRFSAYRRSRILCCETAPRYPSTDIY
jgi:hypothetical protein